MCFTCKKFSDFFQASAIKKNHYNGAIYLYLTQTMNYEGYASYKATEVGAFLMILLSHLPNKMNRLYSVYLQNFCFAKFLICKIELHFEGQFLKLIKA